MRLTFLILAAGLLLTAVAEAAERTLPPVPRDWQSPVLQDHPLVGRIWDAAAEAFVDPAELAARLGGADVALLGEKHDNPDHHRLQAWAIEAMARAGRRPLVAFEMIPRDAAGTLEAYLAEGGDAAGLGPALAWQDSGWPDWALYRPIAEAALDAGLPLSASDLPRAERRQIAERGPGALPAGLRREWGLEAPWTEEMRAGLLEELSAAHCRVAPPEAFAALAEVQRARDAAMADTLADALSGHDGAVLIAGTGHTRPDRGVPWFLERRQPGLETVSIAFVEAVAGEDAPQDYGGLGGHAYLWFTPRVDNADPCEKFAERLERMRTEE
jgi:uncharacterized iron-regulated protein